MVQTIVFDESEVEPIVGTAPSPYNSVIVFAEDEVEPIVGRGVSPYDETVGSYERTVLAQSPADAQPDVPATPEAFNPVALVTSRRGWFGRFDIGGFADDIASLLRTPGGVQRATEALKSLRISNDVGDPVALDDVATAIASRAATSVPSVSGTPEGEYFALELIKLLQLGYTSDPENAVIARLVRTVLPDHKVLEQAPWLDDPDLVAALGQKGAKFQPLTAGGGEVVYDQYSVVIDQLPPGTTARSLARKMAEDLNKIVNNRTFDRINVFHRRAPDSPPSVGDIYDIDIAGIDNGSVATVRQSASSFTLQTVVTGVTGSHPEYGVREFGFRQLLDGGTLFYTRGVSRPQNRAFGAVGGIVQRVSWQSLIAGIAATVTQMGGRPRPNSARGESTAD